MSMTTTTTTAAERFALAPDRAERAAERARRRRRRMAAAPLPATWATDEAAREYAREHLTADTLARLRDMARTVAGRCRGVYGTDADTLTAAAVAALMDRDPRGLADLVAGRADGFARARMTLRQEAGNAMRRATMSTDPGQVAAAADAMGAEQGRAERAAVMAAWAADPAERAAAAVAALAGQGAAADDAAVARVVATAAALAADGPVTILDRDDALRRLTAAERFAVAVGSADSTTTTAERLAAARKVKPRGKVAEQTIGGSAYNAKGAIRIARETSLERLLALGDDTGRPTLDTLTRRGAAEVDPRETAADLAELLASLAAEYLPAGTYSAADGPSLARQVRDAARKLEGLTGAGILRRAAACQRASVAAAALARAAAEQGREAVDAAGAVDADARRAGKRAAAEAARTAEVEAAAALVLLGAYGASRGGRAAARAADLTARAGHLARMAAEVDADTLADDEAVDTARHVARMAAEAADEAGRAVRAGRAVAAGQGAAGRTLPGVALADLVAAACGVTQARKRATGPARETVGTSSIDWPALAAALALPTSDPMVKALRAAVRAAVTDGRTDATADRATWARPVSPDAVLT